MDGFQPEQLDLDRLYANLATRSEEAARYAAIVDRLGPGDERYGWETELARVNVEILELGQLITEKREYERGQTATA